MTNSVRFDEYELLRIFSWYDKTKKSFGDLVFLKFEDKSETKASKLFVERQYEYIKVVYSKVDLLNQLEKEMIKLNFYRENNEFVLFDHDVKINQLEIKKDNISILMKNIAKIIIPEDDDMIPLSQFGMTEDVKNFVRAKP